VPGPASLILASLLLPNGRCCCSMSCAATTLFLSSCSAAMGVLLVCFWDAGSEKCAAGLHTDACLTMPLVLNTVLPLLAAALLLCFSYLPAQLSAAASCHASCTVFSLATPSRAL